MRTRSTALRSVPALLLGAAALPWPAAPCAAAPPVQLSLHATGAITEEVNLSGDLAPSRFCVTTGTPGQQQAYVFAFNKRPTEATLDPAQPGAFLMVSGLRPGDWQATDAAATIIQVSIGGRRFLGVGQSDPAFGVRLSFLPDGEGGSFTATHLMDTDGSSVDVLGSWTCPLKPGGATPAAAEKLAAAVSATVTPAAEPAVAEARAAPVQPVAARAVVPAVAEDPAPASVPAAIVAAPAALPAPIAVAAPADPPAPAEAVEDWAEVVATVPDTPTWEALQMDALPPAAPVPVASGAREPVAVSVATASPAPASDPALVVAAAAAPLARPSLPQPQPMAAPVAAAPPHAAPVERPEMVRLAAMAQPPPVARRAVAAVPQHPNAAPAPGRAARVAAQVPVARTRGPARQATYDVIRRRDCDRTPCYPLMIVDRSTGREILASADLEPLQLQPGLAAQLWAGTADLTVTGSVRSGLFHAQGLIDAKPHMPLR